MLPIKDTESNNPDFYFELFQQNPAPILMYDRESGLRLINESFSKNFIFLDKSKFESLKLYQWSVISDHYCELIEAEHFIDLRFTVEPKSLEKIFLRLEDPKLHVEIFIKAVRPNKIAPIEAYLVYLQIFSVSERLVKLMDENMTQLQAMVENSPMGMHFYQLDENNELIFVDYNPAADRLLGVKNSQFLGKKIVDAFPSLADTDIPERYRLAASEGKIWSTEQINYKDEQLQGAFEVWAFQTSPGKMVALFEDITERKRAELALQHSEAKYRMLIETTHDYVWEVDKDAVFTYVSPQVERLLGYKPEELIGTSALDLIAAEDAPKIQYEYNRLVDSGSAMNSMINVNLHKDGTPVVMESTGLPFYDHEGRLLGYRGMDRDITERQRFFENMQKSQNLESIGILAGGIAHDFNNLLTGIYGFIDLTLMNSNDPKVQSNLNQALSSIDRARALTHQLLTFSRGGDPILQVCSMKDFLKQSVEFILSGKDTKVNYHIDPELWDCEVDRSQIGQVIDNLVINALDAMGPGGMLEIGAENVDLQDEKLNILDAGKYIHISVKDTGPGIDPDIQHKIFDPFFTTKASGTGLGLASSYSIVKKHKGNIDMESSLGQGCVFHIYLPSLGYTSVMETEEPLIPEKYQGKILVMDDEESLRMIFSQMLSLLGFEVEVCNDGQKVVDLLQNRHYDAIILDLTVPGGRGGKDIIPEIQGQVEKIFVTSGYSEDPVMSDPRAFGFTASIPKPFTVDDITHILGRFYS